MNDKKADELRGTYELIIPLPGGQIDEYTTFNTFMLEYKTVMLNEFNVLQSKLRALIPEKKEK